MIEYKKLHLQYEELRQYLFPDMNAILLLEKVYRKSCELSNQKTTKEKNLILVIYYEKAARQLADWILKYHNQDTSILYAKFIRTINKNFKEKKQAFNNEKDALKQTNIS